jgi:hypothetical protein
MAYNGRKGPPITHLFIKAVQNLTRGGALTPGRGLLASRDNPIAVHISGPEGPSQPHRPSPRGPLLAPGTCAGPAIGQSEFKTEDGTVWLKHLNKSRAPAGKTMQHATPPGTKQVCITVACHETSLPVLPVRLGCVSQATEESWAQQQYTAARLGDACPRERLDLGCYIRYTDARCMTCWVAAHAQNIKVGTYTAA